MLRTLGYLDAYMREYSDQLDRWDLLTKRAELYLIMSLNYPPRGLGLNTGLGAAGA